MNGKTIRVLSTILAALMVLSMLACSQQTESNSDTSNGSVETTVAITEETSAEETKLLPELPEGLNYNGAEVRIMQHPTQTGDWSDWTSRDLFAESYTGEPINDAVYERNTYVETLLDVHLNIVDVADMPTAIKQQAMSGTDDYHISTARINSLTATVQGGYLTNLYKLGNVDLEKPWYDENCINEASLYGMLFYVTGSMVILDDDSTGAMVFNKKLIDDFGLDNPYTLVNDGTWTLEKMSELGKKVAGDVDGNGITELDNDRFGILWQRDAIISFLHAGGSRIVTKDKDGEPQFTLNSERTVAIMDLLDSFMFDSAVVQNIHNYEGKYPDIYAQECNVFKDDRDLFMWVRMRVVENLRDMEADFGIIPVPKFSVDQSDYYSTVNKHTAATVCVPNSTAIDLDMTGAVVEAMSAEGYYGLRDAYYENNLGKKIARDPESTDMLDIIMAHRVYDTGEIYDIGGVATQLYSMTQKSSMNFSSFFAKYEKVSTKSLEKFVIAMKALVETAG